MCPCEIGKLGLLDIQLVIGSNFQGGFQEAVTVTSSLQQCEDAKRYFYFVIMVYIWR